VAKRMPTDVIEIQQLHSGFADVALLDLVRPPRTSRVGTSEPRMPGKVPGNTRGAKESCARGVLQSLAHNH
jgi:hypothetical protein